MIKGISRICLILIICVYIMFPVIVNAETPSSSRFYLMEGVYYLINEENLDVAEDFFRKAIVSSSFSTLSEEQAFDRQIAGEAFYFLGKIHYEKAKLASGKDIDNNISWAKKYLREAQEYGIVYDKLHSPLLDEINKKYPAIKEAVSPSPDYKTRAIVEVDHDSYKIDTIMVGKDSDVSKKEFSTNKEFGLEDGARYKMKLDIQSQGNVYKALAAFGIVLLFFITRS